MSGFTVYYHTKKLKDLARVMSDRQRSCFALRKLMLQKQIGGT